MVKCRFCGQKNAIEKSHIVPEFMYEHTYDDKRKILVIDPGLKELKPRKKGYYEPILCLDCEGFFNDNFEKTCVEFIKNLPDNAPINSFIKFEATKNLNFLLLSIVWRASMARGENWKGLELGPHQEKIKHCLQNGLVENGYQFWTFIVSSKRGIVQKGLVSSVQCIKVKSHNLYHFVAGGLQFVVKISSHSLYGVQPEAMSFDKPFSVLALDIEDLPSLQEIFENRRQA